MEIAGRKLTKQYLNPYFDSFADVKSNRIWFTWCNYMTLIDLLQQSYIGFVNFSVILIKYLILSNEFP